MREAKVLPMRWRVFGPKVAWVTFCDGLIPPGKSPRYIRTIEASVDNFLAPLVQEYKRRGGAGCWQGSHLVLLVAGCGTDAGDRTDVP